MGICGRRFDMVYICDTAPTPPSALTTRASQQLKPFHEYFLLYIQ